MSLCVESTQVDAAVEAPFDIYVNVLTLALILKVISAEIHHH